MRALAVSAALIVTTFLAACAATPPPLNTPSGKPEVTINSSDRSAVKGALINVLMTNGYSIDQDSDFTLLVSKEVPEGKAIMYQAMYGNANSSAPRISIQISMGTVNGQTRVMAIGQARMKNAYGKEDVQDITKQNGPKIMEYLNQAKSMVESK